MIRSHYREEQRQILHDILWSEDTTIKNRGEILYTGKKRGGKGYNF